MKKLILGLSFTVVSSGFVFANGIDKPSEYDVFAFNLSDEDSNINSDEALLSCYHGYKTITVGCDGVKSSINLGGHESSCAANEADGTITIHVSGPISTCQAGALKDFNDALDWITPLT